MVTPKRKLRCPETGASCVKGCRRGDCRLERDARFRQKAEEIARPARVQRAAEKDKIERTIRRLYAKVAKTLRDRNSN